MDQPALAPEKQLDATTVEEAIAYLRNEYADAVKLDDREGYGGVIVDSKRLVDVARAIRDDLGIRLLVERDRC